MGASQNYNVNLNINANTQSAQQQLQNLHKQLQNIASMQINVSGTSALTSNIQEASQAALKLSSILKSSTNMQTGNLDFTKFSNSLKKNNIDIIKYGQALQEIGPSGQKAFVGLAQAIAKSEIPMRRTTQLTQKMWDGFKRTAGWQLQSSLIHGIVGGVQKAVGYAKDLNKSLTDIQIVTGQSSDQMAKFAQHANKAAKNLNTTTTEYTKASLIYYQQGLSDADVKARTETTIKMANVTGTSAQKVSDQMTAIWNNYDNGTKSLTHYADVMTALGAATASSTDEIAQGLQKFASISNTVGLSYEYAATALATITSESRESADVVGNALKTLFSRIQGLQLGETLDDGTTLNKYSTALAKAGISIKDQAGGLKDMDSILDEMGSKWQTLERDEKMALAQTVAGVRQYTQLMTLMENWDDFKQNLNIANTSAGTLDSQAEIYADSWEAASKRVRTSFEGLWDKLISSEGFTKALNALSGFVDILGKLVDGMGGATGVFATFGGVLTRVFSSQIASGLSNFAYGVKMLMPGAYKSQIEKKNTLLTDFTNSMKSGHMEGLGEKESQVQESIINRQIDSAKRYIPIQDKLTPDQQYANKFYEDLIAQNDAQQIANAQKQDQIKSNISDIVTDQIYNQDMSKYQNKWGLDANYVTKTRDGKILDRNQSRRDYFQELGSNYESRIASLKKMSLQENFSIGDKDNFVNSLNLRSKEDISEVNKIIDTLRSEDRSDGDILKAIQDRMPKLRDQAIDRAASMMNLTEEELKNMTPEEQEAFRRSFAAYGKEHAKQIPLEAEGKALKEKGKKLAEEQENATKPQKTQDTARKMVNLASGLTSTVAAISSIESLGDQIRALGDGAGDATAVLGSLVSVTSNSLMALSSLSSVMGGPLTAGLVAVLGLGTMLIKYIDKTNISEKERIKALEQSDAELKNATDNNKNLIESYKTQNENYTESIEKIKSTAYDPDQLVNDIFQANKQAVELISEYGLTKDQYTRDSAGLIKIDEQVLEDKLKSMEEANMDLQRTSAISPYTTDKELAEIAIKDILSGGGYTTYQELDYSAAETPGFSNPIITRYFFGDEKGNQWTFEDAVKVYGTKEWDAAKQYAISFGYDYEEEFKKLEEQILEYQEATNLMNLALRNNVDSILKAQKYTLDGYETFTKLGLDDYQKAYQNQYDTGDFSGSTENSLLNDKNEKRIKEYLKAQGYTGIKNIKFDGSDIAKFTFDHDEGSGDVNVEAIRKWDAEQAGESAAISTFGKSMSLLETLYQTQGEDAAPGLMSLLTGDNFENATIVEMNKAKEAAAAIAADMYKEWDEKGENRKGTDEDIAASISKHFGKDMTAAELKDLLNLDPSTNLIDWFNNFKHVQSSAQRLIEGEPLLKQWVGDNEEIANNINQNTLTSLYSNFKQASLLGGEQAGKDMLAGITEVLSNSGLSEDEYDQALQGLLSIDWSNTLSSGGAAAAVIENLGGTLDTTTAAWQAFASAMEAVNGAMPDFSEVIAQLTDLAAAVQGLSGGDLIDPEIVEQLINLNPEFADMFSKHHSGKYTFIGEDNKALKGAIWDEMNNKKTEASEVEQAYKDYMEGDGKGQESNNTIDAKDFERIAGPYSTHWYADNHAMQLASLAGYSKDQVTNILDTYSSANTNLGLWTKDYGKTMSDGTRVRVNSEGTYEQQNTDGTWSEVTDPGKLADYVAMHAADQTRFNTAKAARDTMLNSIHGLDEVSGEWTQEEVEAAVSTADSAADVFDRIKKGQAGLLEDGIISEGALKGLQALPDVSDRVKSAVQDLAHAKQALEEDDSDANQAAYEEALAYAELQAQIDATAAARGLDAEAVAAQAEAIRENLSEAGVDASGIAEAAADAVQAQAALEDLNKSASDFQKLAAKIAKQDLTDPKDLQNLSKMQQLFTQIAGAEDLVIKDTNKLNNAFQKFLKDNPDAMQDFLNGSGDAIKKWQAQAAQIKADELLGTDFADTAGDALDALGETMGQYSDQIDSMKIGQSLQEAFGAGSEEAANLASGMQNAVQSLMDSGMSMGDAMDLLADATDFKLVEVSDASEADVSIPYSTIDQEATVGAQGEVDVETVGQESGEVSASGGSNMKFFKIVKTGGSGGSGGGGGGGGGGGPKKVANKRKSQTVKRYKKNDARRSSAASAKKSASRQKDYLYGESKIAQMEKINKLAEKEARITSDRIKESRKYMIEDRENLIKYMQKYGYEAEFNEDGFLKNYEDAWTKIHDKIAKLYEDNELTKDEQKLEEEYKVELEELEGSLEDYENSLSELQADIEAYEESLYEMYDNKVEQMQHKVEFKIELDEDDLSYLDFWIEALGDSLYNALEVLQTLGKKTNILFDGLDTYKQGIEDIYALSDDPLHTWATGGMDELLTQDQVDALRENRDGLMEYMKQLIDLRNTMQDKVLEVFDKWQDKLESTMSTIEHYSSVIEHFKNIIDVVGKDPLGLNNQFMTVLEQNAVNQSMDTIDATKAHYDAIVASNAEAQKNLEAAIASGDQARIEHWEGVVQSTTEAMQEAQDSLLSSLENTLTMIADQFESAMTRAVEAFNDAIYAHGGLQGLQDDYSSIREQSQLMAEDYQKIYELSKLNRNINKTLNDSNIIAGKQKMKSLQQEINELQASGVQLSQYDLEYLQAKYELRLAEIELENAQNNKDTVRLSKDSEGNWSYIYTSSVDKVDEAQQKYEDALYKMQNLSYEYMEEMSTTMMQTSLAMMEEIQALRIQDFDSYEAYSAEVQRIQDKYSAYLNNQQNELNKSVANNEELYNRDWQSYNATTGYKISANQDWADSYSETTLGALMDSESKTSDFANVIFNLSNMFTDELGTSAQNYFANAEMAMNKYGTSIKNFGTTTTSTMTNISSKSKTAADDMKAMAQDMTNSFKEIADAVVDWQEEFSGQINSMLEEIGKLVESINDAIQKSAEMTSGKTNSGELIGTSDAIKLLNEKKELGKFEAGENGQIVVNGETYANWVEYNGKFIEAIDAKLAEYSQAPLGSEQRKQLAEELKGLFRRYHLFKEVVDRIYDPTSKSTLDLENPNYSSFDTGGYTGEWGKSGKFAMLHEKELILNSDDTENFLSALNVSRDIIHSIIEMNARQSSLALGNLVPSSIQDMSQNLEQQVSITAEFPNATNHSEIEEAFNNLINTASQYANRYPF